MVALALSRLARVESTVACVPAEVLTSSAARLNASCALRSTALRRGDVRLRLIDRGRVLGLFDLIEQIARLDVLAVLEVDLLQKAFDAGAHLIDLDRLDAADEGQERRYAALLDRDNADRRRRRRRRLRRRGRLASGQRDKNRERRDAS